jgi:hypothetical protein
MTVLSLILAGLGLVFILIAALLNRHARRQLSWEQVPGVIEVSSVELLRENFAPSVKYSYEVRGRRYTGQRLRSLQITSSFRGPSERVAEAYPAGKQVTVYVNPLYPTDSVLEPGGDRWMMMFALVFGGFIVLMSAVLYFGTSAR